LEKIETFKYGNIPIQFMVKEIEEIEEDELEVTDSDEDLEIEETSKDNEEEEEEPLIEEDI
jgi:hypothetical protein